MTSLAIDLWSVDCAMIQSLVMLSSSEAARQAAAAWLAAFEAARCAGASEAEAHGRANQAWRASGAKDSGPACEDSGMLASSVGSWTDARPPPFLVA